MMMTMTKNTKKQMYNMYITISIKNTKVLSRILKLSTEGLLKVWVIHSMFSFQNS